MRRGTIPSQFARYLVTGGVAALVDLLGFLVLLGAGLPLVPAAALSFTAAILLNFALSSYVVFAVPMTRHRFVAYIGFAMAGLVINTTVTALAAGVVGLIPWAAKILGIGTAFVFNFLVNALIVFRTRARDAHSG